MVVPPRSCRPAGWGGSPVVDARNAPFVYPGRRSPSEPRPLVGAARRGTYAPGVQPRASLPTAVTPFVGRVDELATVLELVLRPDVRLVTITGTAGVGKT